jgi:hypothetical protein
MITPIEAKQIQKGLLKSHKRQIHEKKKKDKLSGLTDEEVNDKNFLTECRKSKLLFEKERHSDIKKIEATKISIQKERLTMEKESKMLVNSQIMAQTKLDNQKAMLVKLEMYKEHLALKNSNPDISDKFLDKHFPI